jgi:PAS domain S-box-containing protein
MADNIHARLTTFLVSREKKSSVARGLIFFSLLLLVLGGAGFSLSKTYQQQTRFEISRKEFLAKVAAVTVREKVKNLIHLGSALALNPFLVQAVHQNDYVKARDAMVALPALFPFIKQVFVTNPDGILVGIFPDAPEAVGTIQSKSQWYKSIMKTARPYVSSVYKPEMRSKNMPSSENVITIAVPLLPPGSKWLAGQAETVIRDKIQGILVLQIKLNSFEDILKPMQLDTGQMAYLVDREGRVIYHPTIPSADKIVDFSGIPIMGKLLRGQNGAEIGEDPMGQGKELIVYDPIPDFGWGVVLSEPVKVVFRDRDKTLWGISVFYFTVLVLGVLLVHLVLRIVRIQTEGREKLQDSYNLLHAVFEGTSDMVFVKDFDGRYVMINSVGQRWYGKSQQEIIGKSDGEILPDAEARQFQANDRQMMTQGDGLSESEETFHAGGRDLVLHTVRTLHRDHHGRILGVIGVARDITERKNIELKNRELVEAKAHFVSMVSHELRTPLTALKEGISIVLDGVCGVLNEEQKYFLQIGGQNVERLHRLIDSILDFRKLSAGKMTFLMEENSLQAVIREVYETMKLVTNQRGLELVMDADEKLPPIRFDRDKIVQVLTNLLNNSIKFTEKGSITIRLCQEPEGMAKVSVTDTGSGIEETDLPKLFQSFQQLDNAREKSTGGSGLGLAICREIIGKHGGKIWAQSQIGKGTSMHFILPIAERRQIHP